jgi:ribosome modulation factor
MAENNSAFAEGVDAFSRGKSRDDCPYPSADERRRLWLDGYDAAKLADDLHVDGMP